MKAPVATRRAAESRADASIRACQPGRWTPPQRAVSGPIRHLSGRRSERAGNRSGGPAPPRARRPVRHVRALPAALPDLSDQPGRSGIATRADRVGAVDRGRSPVAEPDRSRPPRSMPGLPVLPEGLPVRSAVRRDHHVVPRNVGHAASATGYRQPLAHAATTPDHAGPDRRVCSRVAMGAAPCTCAAARLSLACARRADS